MTLEQVVELIRDALIQAHYTGRKSLTEEVLIQVARDVWIEHQALPDLHVPSIIYRRLTGSMTQTEREFWRGRGLRFEDFE